MNQLTLALLLTTGALLGVGVFLVVGSLIPATPGLGATLDRLDGVDEGAAGPQHVALAADASRSERLGAWVHAHTPIPLGRTQLRTLQLRNTSVAEFYADKAVLAIVGAGLPLVLGFSLTLLIDITVLVPAGLALVGAGVGWFVPDLLLRRAASTVRSDAGEALFTFFDLVTLERLANLSGTQSLHSAAALSDATLFVQIRAALERARLEQQPPYTELKALADRLNLPEMADIADVMRLDETGAALSGALRARVKELRDAHLTRAKIAANEVSERMTVFMVIPSLVFGLIFLVPPMLRLVLG